MKAQNKKALSAATPKASNLKLVSDKDTNMNNTATQQNNQPQQESWALAFEAQRVSRLIGKSASALRSLSCVISNDLTNRCTGDEHLNAAILEGLTDAIELIANHLGDGGNDLGNTLVKGGYVNE